jgi:exonuclease III
MVDSYFSDKANKLLTPEHNSNLTKSLIHNSNSNNLTPYRRNPSIDTNNFKIFHQNVRGLSGKVEELLFSLANDNYPHILCITEHHMRLEEINITNLEQYNLGTFYCRYKFKQGGVSIYIKNGVKFEIIDLKQFCKDKDLEICALRVKHSLADLIILCVYRSPSGDFYYFMTQIEVVLNTLYKISHNLIICGDFNVNSLDITSKAPVLKSLLQSFGLENTVNFPTRIMHSSQTLIDYIFLNKKTLYTITYPLINGISDHDGQIVTLLDVFNPPRLPLLYI